MKIYEKTTRPHPRSRPCTRDNPDGQNLALQTPGNGLISTAYAQSADEVDAAAQKYAEKKCKSKKPVAPKPITKGKKESNSAYQKRLAAYNKKLADYKKKLAAYQQCIETKTDEYFNNLDNESSGQTPSGTWNQPASPKTSTPTPSAGTSGQSASDASLASQLESTIWCTSSYHGSSDYSYSSYSVTKYQFMADGRVLTATSGESSSSGYGGNYYGGSTGGDVTTAGMWKIDNGRLMFASSDTGGQYVDSLSEITSYGFKSTLLNLEFSRCQ